MIESRCGLLCGDCSFREAMGCKGCVHMDKPFWANSCPVKSCCAMSGKQSVAKKESFNMVILA